MVGLYNGKRRDQKIDNIDRPKVEIEMPDFIALADEILE